VRLLARFLAVVGVVAVAWLLFAEGPKEVVLVYDLAEPDATALEVELRRGGELVRRAEFRVAGGVPIRHEVRLAEGDYALGWRVASGAGTRRGERALEIRESGTIVLPIGR
jgi:hypothetical protein